jgi:hypothetical protein
MRIQQARCRLDEGGVGTVDMNFDDIFFLNEAKVLPFRLIKKKRIARLINGKLG